MTGLPAAAITEHEHWFTALWSHLGPLGRQDIHIHSCIEGDPGDCYAVIAGYGRECDGDRAKHVRSELPLPGDLVIPGEPPGEARFEHCPGCAHRKGTGCGCVCCEPHPEGNPALAAAVEAIVRRRLASAHYSDLERTRAALLLDALPDAAVALGAAAPHLAAADPTTETEGFRAYQAGLITGRAEGAAAERELVLVWRDEHGAEICRSAPLTPGTCRIGIPVDAEHADLLDGGQP